MHSSDHITDTLCRAINTARQVSSDFDLNPQFAPPQGRILKPAAVLIAVSDTGDVILTKRSTRLKNHAGQIAFAGGRMDDTDRDLIHTALREADEEIGLDQTVPTILGALPTHETVTGYQVTPIVARIPDGVQFSPEEGEVSEVFTVSLRHVLRPQNYRIEGRHWRGQRRQYYTIPVGPYYIWGATARILRQLAEGAV